MKENYNYKGFDIVHTIKPRMKNIYLRIGEDGLINISSPNISKKEVYELIDKKEAWIKKSLHSVAQKPQLVLGEEILFFGETYVLDEHSQFKTLKYQCINNSQEQIKIHYQNFYYREAYFHLEKRLAHFATLMQLQPTEMKLRRMKRQWGNCRSNGVITFNIHLMQAPKECIDYVVVHELAHMIHMNHSKAFHALVDTYLPQSKEKMVLLKQFSASI